MTVKSKAKDSVHALDLLKKGNASFVTGLERVEDQVNLNRLRHLAEHGQRPFAVVLTCSDSRIPVELVFDQGLGDLFVIRVAGNVVQDSQLASIEYAVQVLETPLVVVLGHSQCGAVGAAVDNESTGAPLPSAHLTKLINLIRPAVKSATQAGAKGREALLESSIRWNAQNTVNQIQDQSGIVRDAVEDGRAMVTGAVFSLETGKVDFFS